MPPAAPDLALGVVHYRVPDVLRRCLERLLQHGHGVAITVVDTGPGDEARQVVDALDDRARAEDRIDVLRVANVGYAHATNRFFAHALRSRGGAPRSGSQAAQGAAQPPGPAPSARPPLVGVMNADVLIEADTLPRLLAAFDDPDVGLVGPSARTPDGSLQPMGPAYRWHHLRRRLQRRVARRDHVDVPWVSGCLMVARSDAIDGPAGAGGMDASFRFYNEDLEWCLRLRRAGWSVRLCSAEVLHLGGASTPPAPAFRIEGYRGGMVLRRRLDGPRAQALHRAAVRLEAALRSRVGSAATRAAYRAIAAMFARQRYDSPPFGATLDAREPGPVERG